jgi:uncharacterized protein (DUF983 family)
MRIAPLLRRRCPRCREGAIFAGLLRMHPQCPVCGLVFHREPGYFLGAMYFSYALGVAAVTPLVVWGLAADWPLATIGWAATALLAVLSPWLFQYSRVLWLWFDRSFDRG